MSNHQDTILYGLKSGAAAAKTPGERLLLTKAADEIASLRARLERARRGLEEIDNADIETDVWTIAHVALRELDSEGGGK